MQFLVGCDPEYFVAQKGIFKSAFGLIRGDKKNPLKVDRGAVQVDGMALEFNIDPAASVKEFVYNIDTVLAQLQAMVPDHDHVFVPVADFEVEYMKSQPKEALELGCDPDFNAYTGNANDKPDGDRPFRTASGHVHIGWTQGASLYDASHLEVARCLVRELDFYLGLPSLFYDTDVKRRTMYGRAGCYRPKSYGVEYRTLSNAWLLTQERKEWVFKQVQKACKGVENGVLLQDKFGSVEDIINNSDTDAAIGIIKKAKLEIVK